MADFSAIEWAKLSTAERAKACRTYATEAEKLANGQTGALGIRYMAIAQRWHELAAEIELAR